MPQDELWAASARLTGLQLTVMCPLPPACDHYRLTIAPRWSKQPSGRNGFAELLVPTYAAWHLSDVTNAVWEQFLGGDAKHIPMVAGSKLRTVLGDFRQGVRS